MTREMMKISAAVLLTLAAGSALHAAEAGPYRVAGDERPRASSSYLYREDGSSVVKSAGGDIEPAAENGWPVSMFEAATAGSYVGTVGGRTFSLTVDGSNRITGWSSGGDYNCPGYTVTNFSHSGDNCAIAGNGSFTCGSLSCSIGSRSRISGTFSGAMVTGILGFQVQPLSLPCCSHPNEPFTASLPVGSLRFTGAAQSVQEGAGSATVTVQRVNGTAGAVSVHYASADGTATGDSDYTPVSETLNWAAGDGASKSFQVPILDDGDAEGDETLTLALSAPTGGATLGTPSTQTLTILDDDSVEPGPCIEDDHTLCLLSERFRVEVTFTPPGGVEQSANAIPFTDRAGMFWFFNEANIEMLVKMQNACVPPFNRFWVFYGATTNVEFHVTVTDTVALQQKHYDNPQGMVALPVADTQAFATCP
jgi:hypothetical protein